MFIVQFHQIQLHSISSDPKKVSDLDVYKIFTRTPLTELHVDRLFKSHSDFAVVDWLAYPEYDIIPDDVEVSELLEKHCFSMPLS